MSFLKKLFSRTQKTLDSSPTPINTPQLKIENHKVTGVTHYLDNILSLKEDNPDYNLSKKEMIDEGLTDERIYQYLFYTAETELIPEPDNPLDPNAIKVVVDGVHVGYIKAGSCAHIHNLIREDRIDMITSDIGGGKYKILHSDVNEAGKDIYNLEKDETPYFVHISIYEKIK